MNDTATTLDAAVPSTDGLDPDRIEAFARQVLRVIADASTALTLSIGHRTRLFDVLAEPAEHAAVLTRGAGPDNLAKLAQFIGLMADVEHQVVRCSHEGGGVPYSAYAEF